MTSMNGLLVFVLGMCTSSYWCLFSVCYGLPPFLLGVNDVDSGLLCYYDIVSYRGIIIIC